MTDQMDNRLKELVNQLAASAPEAPPFPQKTAAMPSPARRMPAWALSVAGAVAVLVAIGVPFLLFSGGRSGDVATTVPTPTSLTPPSTAIPTPATTAPDTALIPACVPGGLTVQRLEQEGAAGSLVTPLRITNVSGSPCNLEQPVAVTGVGTGGEEVSAALGGLAPIGEDSGPLVEAGGSRMLVIETGTGCEGGRVVGPEAVELRLEFASGDLVSPFTGDLGCNFSYAEFAVWFDIEPPTTEELALINAFASSWAAGPLPEPFFAFADTVTLTLGPAIARTETAESLSDPAAWSFDQQDGFRAYVGPFSALDLLAQGRPYEVTAGPHPHCAGPPMPINEALVGLRQLSIQPTDATSCLEWWTVDLFLTEQGQIAGVTLDLWEP